MTFVHTIIQETTIKEQFVNSGIAGTNPASAAMAE
jgi:hypothetical protein